MEELILQRTSSLFLKDGIHHFTMDDVAGLMGISKKTLYRFYPSRQDLIEKICHWLATEYENNINGWNNQTVNSLDKLLGFISGIVGFSKAVNPVFFRDLRRHYPTLWIDLQDQLENTIHNRIQILLEKGIMEGLFRNNLQPRLVIDIWKQHIQSDFEHASSLVNDYSKDEVFRQSIYLFLYGIIAPQAISQLEEKLFQIDWKNTVPIPLHH